MAEPLQCTLKCQVSCWFVCDDHTFGYNSSVGISDDNKGISTLALTEKCHSSRLVNENMALVIFQWHWTTYGRVNLSQPADFLLHVGVPQLLPTLLSESACHVTYTQVQLIHVGYRNWSPVWSQPHRSGIGVSSSCRVDEVTMRTNNSMI